MRLLLIFLALLFCSNIATAVPGCRSATTTSIAIKGGPLIFYYDSPSDRVLVGNVYCIKTVGVTPCSVISTVAGVGSINNGTLIDFSYSFNCPIDDQIIFLIFTLLPVTIFSIRKQKLYNLQNTST